MNNYINTNAILSGFYFLSTPLYWVAGGDSTAMVELLVRRRGASMNANTPRDNATPLNIAEGIKREVNATPERIGKLNSKRNRIIGGYLTPMEKESKS